jgi:integrase
MARISPKVRLRTRKRGDKIEYWAVWYDNTIKDDRSLRVYAETERLARDRCDEIEIELEEGREPRAAGKPKLLSKLAEDYLAWMKARYHENTITQHREGLTKFFRFLQEKHPNVSTAKQVRANHIEDWQTWRKSQKVRRQVKAVRDSKGKVIEKAHHAPTDKPVSNRTVNMETAGIYGLFQWAAHKERRHVASNPVKGVKKLREAESETLIVDSSNDATLENFLAQNKRHGSEYALAFRIFVETGLRPSELFKGLRKIDVDYNNALLRVVKNEFYSPKTGKERAVPVSDETLARLRGQVAAHDGPRVFTCTVKGFQQAIWAAKQATGIRVNPYSLRHSAATRYLAVGNLKIVQDLLGHKEISTTARYPKILVTDIVATAQKVFAKDAQIRATTRAKVGQVKNKVAVTRRKYKRKSA